MPNRSESLGIAFGVSNEQKVFLLNKWVEGESLKLLGRKWRLMLARAPEADVIAAKMRLSRMQGNGQIKEKNMGDFMWWVMKGREICASPDSLLFHLTSNDQEGKSEIGLLWVDVETALTMFIVADVRSVQTDDGTLTEHVANKVYLGHIEPKGESFEFTSEVIGEIIRGESEEFVVIQDE